MPYRKIVGRNQRELIVKLLFEWLPLVYAVYSQDGPELWGRHVDEMMVFYALLLGTVDGRYIGVQKVSQWTGQPKATVHRRIETMVQLGKVQKSPSGKGYMVSPEIANSPKTIATVSRICHMIEVAGRKLSKMEPMEIEP